MDRAVLVAMIGRVLREQVLANGMEASQHVGDDARLYGDGGLLDSLGLVNLVLDVEQEVNALTGKTITIVDERAMSQKHSPFRTVGRLADYVLRLLEEDKDA